MLGISEIKNRCQRRVDAPLLLLCEMAGDVTEAADVDSTDMLDENPRAAPRHVDGRAE